MNLNTNQQCAWSYHAQDVRVQAAHHHSSASRRLHLLGLLNEGAAASAHQHHLAAHVVLQGRAGLCGLGHH